MATNDEGKADFPGFPPYDLRPKRKREILGSLKLLEPYGKNYSDSGWSKVAGQITGIVLDGIHCARTTPVWISMTHGDLNSHNILLLEHSGTPTVVFIDLAWMHLSNHTLHDYARIEAEFKFTLMDCGPLRAGFSNYDNAGNKHITEWLKKDTASLLGEKFLEQKIDPVHTCVDQCYQMISTVRRFARDKQAQELKVNDPEDMDFQKAYKAALLHITLSAITYDLPYAKRIFAALSAANLIGWLQTNLGR